MADARRTLGTRGEVWAADHLQAAGFEIVARNWRCAAGEIDLVATVIAPDYSTGDMAAQWLVLVEVRTRRGMRFGSARASVAAHKQAKLRELAQRYVAETAWRGPWRIDVIAIQLLANQPPQIEHIARAVQAE
ncbi:MAG: YraN family protein [Litorilinea sp.]